MFQYTTQEETYYKQLWAIFDPQVRGFTEAKGTVQFFKKSQLPVDTLKGIWIAGVQNQEGKLYYTEFAIIMRLIAYCQNGFEFNQQLLNQNMSVPLANMEGIQQQQSIIQQPQNLLPQSNYFQTQPISNTAQFSIQSQIEPKLEFQKYYLFDDQYNRYESCFNQQDQTNQEFIKSDQAQSFFLKSQLSIPTLNQLLNLVDIGQKGYLLKNEFIVALHLIALIKQDIPLPQILPDCLLQFIRRDKQQNQVRLNSQNVSQISSVLSQQSERIGVLNEVQGLNHQANCLKNKLQNQTQQIQFANNLDQQKQIIEDKKRDIEFLDQSIQKLQIFYDYLKKEQDELQAQITLLNDQQIYKSNILQDSQQNQLEVNQNQLKQQFFDRKSTNQLQENQQPTLTTQFYTIKIDDDYDYTNYKVKKNQVICSSNQLVENLPWY